ncbi:DedA family protein [Halomarina pelagica]|uniref:DedA family protein n=1 Tax=Halomarina pelagica TaxID=2961599 RepID=UPI0020C26BD9|nr:DedA family protein [Halomarina sp. BND7]
MDGGITQTALALVVQYGLLAVFVFTFLESSMLFPLLPSEVVVPAAAAALVTDPASLALFVAVATLGTTCGSAVAYGAGRAGEEALDRYGRYLRLSEGELRRGQRWFRRYGSGSVCWGRLLPVLRSVVSIPAGVAEMNPARFGLYTAVGAFAFNAAVAGLVYAGEERSIYAVAVGTAADAPLLTLLGLLALIALGLAGWRLYVNVE